MKNYPILDKNMQFCKGKELLLFPIFPFHSLRYLPAFHRFSTFRFPSFPFPIYPILPSPSTSLPCPFRSYLHSSFPFNLPHSLSTFPFPSHSSPFPSLLFHFPPAPYLSPFPPFLLPHLSLFPLLPFFLSFYFPFIFPLNFFRFSPFPSPLPHFSFPFTPHFLPRSLLGP